MLKVCYGKLNYFNGVADLAYLADLIWKYTQEYDLNNFWPLGNTRGVEVCKVCYRAVTHGNHSANPLQTLSPKVCNEPKLTAIFCKESASG